MNKDNNTPIRHRIALAGCGRMAATWVEYVLERPDCEFVAFIDVSDAAMDKMAQTYSINCPHFHTVKEAVEQTNPSVLFDLTVPEAHVNVTVEALQLGVNVIGEKPMSTSIENCKHMVDVAVASGKSYALMQNRRFIRDQRDLISFLDTGLVGKPVFVNADFFLGTHFLGFRQLMDHVLVLDMAIHTFDQARAITGAKPVSVYCHEFNPANSTYHGAANAVCIFEMDNGSVFCYRGSWAAEGFDTEWESQWRICCLAGTVMWDGKNRPVAARPTGMVKERMDVQTIEIPRLYEGREMHYGCLDEALKALEEDRPAETDCRDNLESMKMVFGAIKSAETGRKVYMSEL